MPIEVQIDSGMCMGAGECIALVPSVFHWGSSKTQAEATVPGPADTEVVYEAAQSCPNFAITVVETD
jgi:ferredoxin